MGQAGGGGDRTRRFLLGCCAGDNACSSGFGEDVSSEAYATCTDDTAVAACGSPAPLSRVALAGAGPMRQPGRPETLEEACAAQAATNCPGVETATRCTSLCVSTVDSFPGCTQPWIELNACMSEAPLFCDVVNGGAAVSADDCGPEIDAWTTC